ncbi:hypothetical protein LCD36_04605 [Saccharopolyspora sp. 6T]|uniref:hypothetical protein n=1 Tax=Saccharopolyspora sp. 6T TaxID=2877238 RepID=UPI001CD5B67D|nr:hypothetical protein [Saccharopolyspora sp. 6T]MCA1185733.1 hypothetical protein [Saccharopolyspora sp. 6T]
MVRPAHWQSQSTERDESQTSEMEVRHKSAPPIRFGEIGRDAYETAKTVFTGQVLTARPPSMRDRYERVRRAHWAGDADVLRRFGQVASVPPLVLAAVCQVGMWVSAPLRFYVCVVIGLIVVLIAVL